MAFTVYLSSGCSGTPNKGYIVYGIDSATTQSYTINLKDLGGSIIRTASTGNLSGLNYPYYNAFYGLENLITTAEVIGSVDGNTATYANNGGNNTFVIGCSTPPPCNLIINSVTINNDVNASAAGSVVVNATSSYSIEYKLGSGSWQSGNTFLGVLAGTYTVYVRDSNSCSDQENITLGNNACNITLTLFQTEETSVGANDGTVTGTATSQVAGIQFSLDGGVFQSSSLFTGIAPGIHTLYARDVADCSTYLNFTIIEAVPDVPIVCFDPTISVSSVVPYRFKILKCDTADQTDELFNDETICGVFKDCFYQLLSCTDVITLQIYYIDEEFYSLPVLKVYNYSTDALIDTINFVSVGDGIYQIEQNVTGISGICEKKVYFKINSKSPSSATEFYTHARSEPIYVSNNHDCTEVLEYWNNSNFQGVEYESSSYRNKLRVPAQFWKNEFPQEKEVYRKSNGEIVKLRENISKITNLEIGYVPSYVHEKITIALAHDHIRINNIEYVSESNYSFDVVSRFALAKGSAKLSTKNYYKKNLIR